MPTVLIEEYVDPYLKDLFQVIAWIVASVGGLVAASLAIRQASLSRAQSLFEHEQTLKLELYKELGDLLVRAQDALVHAITKTNAFVDRARDSISRGRPIAPNDAGYWEPQNAAAETLDALNRMLEKYELLFFDASPLGSIISGPLALTEASGRFALTAVPFISSREQPSPIAEQLDALKLSAAEYQALAALLYERVQALRVHAQNVLLGPLLGRRLPLQPIPPKSLTRD